ncbi:MAG: indole-3-glycerol-phosphate synthase [Methanospirillum sp.]|nr:indole-3-glycerol-phosphate synthase [Methanospirillum sp.]
MILDEIISSSELRAAALPGSFPESGHAPISLHTTITREKHNAIIAELKFASPSRGPIREEKKPEYIVGELIRGGCCALSVLTEPTYFRGNTGIIRRIRDTVSVPILRKDFIVDTHQLDETRSIGADAVLLISSVLGEETGHFVEETVRRGIEPLVEVNTRQEARAVLDTGAELVEINNRDLKTFRTDLSTTKRIAPILREAGKTVIAASGMIWPCDVRTLHQYADGFLIGSSIMSSDNPRKRVEGFVYA